jgi:hypothetical protein
MNNKLKEIHKDKKNNFKIVTINGAKLFILIFKVFRKIYRNKTKQLLEGFVTVYAAKMKNSLC